MICGWFGRNWRPWKAEISFSKQTHGVFCTCYGSYKYRLLKLNICPGLMVKVYGIVLLEQNQIWYLNFVLKYFYKHIFAWQTLTHFQLTLWKIILVMLNIFYCCDRVIVKDIVTVTVKVPGTVSSFYGKYQRKIALIWISLFLKLIMTINLNIAGDLIIINLIQM